MKLRRTFALLLLLTMLLNLGIPAAAKSRYSMPYYITVDLTNQIVTVYNTLNDVVVRQMICSSGMQNATPKGIYYMPQVGEDERTGWYYFSMYGGYAQYASRIVDNVMFHSIPCSAKSQKTVSQSAIRSLGQPASHGCIRLRLEDARFIAENCAPGTRVEIFKSRKENEDLRQLLLQSSYDSTTGQTYDAFLGVATASDALGLNSTGSEVLDLQSRLRSLGIYDGEVTGEYTGATVNAVRSAQALMGLEITGIADAGFRQALFSESAPVAYNVALSSGMNGPAVRSLQQHLSYLGIYDGPVDGVFDQDVSDALNRFQAAYGCLIDSAATVEVQKAIAYEYDIAHSLFDPLGGYGIEVIEETIDFGRVEANSGIRVRAEPNGTCEVLGLVENNALVLLLEKGSEWSRIQHGSVVGFVKNEWVKFKPWKNCVFRYAASDDNVTYSIGHTHEEYLAGQIAMAETLSQRQESFFVVNTGRDDLMLNLRRTPDTQGEVIETLPNGTEVRRLLDVGEWSLADHNGTRGFLMNQYIASPEDGKDEPDEPVVLDTSILYALIRPAHGSKAYYYDSDSDDAEVLGTLQTPTRVDVIENLENGWSLILLEGRQVYMRDEDLLFRTTSGK